MKLAEKYGGWALVTGSARGIGATFAHALAAEGFDLLMVDALPRQNAETARTVAEQHGVTATPIDFDLTREDLEVAAQKWTNDYEIGMFVNNAGISPLGDFLDIDLGAHQRTLDVNGRATLILTHVIGRQMRQRKRGAIILLSSQSCIVGAPYAANYAGTKAYALNLALALHHELASDGVDVLGLCPGVTDTPKLRALGMNPAAARYIPVTTPSKVVDKALRTLGRQPFLLPTWRDRMSTRFLANLLPRRTALALVGTSIKKLRGSAGATDDQPTDT